MNSTTQEWIHIIESGRAYDIRPATIEKGLLRLNHDHFHRVLLSHSSAGDKVLEAGCGEAYYSFALAAGGRIVTALDISPVLIARLQKIDKSTSVKTSNRLKFIIGDIFDLSSLKQQFNLVFNHGVYEHWLTWNERSKILENIAMSLKCHGRYALAVPNLKNPMFYLSLSRDHVPAMQAFTMGRIRAELLHHGMETIDKGYLFVGPGYEQWVKHKWLVYPVELMRTIYRKLPSMFQRLFSAHIYCVGKRVV